MTQYVTVKQPGLFPALHALQEDGRLTSELASAGAVDAAVAELKRQIDAAAKQLKRQLQEPADVNQRAKSIVDRVTRDRD